MLSSLAFTASAERGPPAFPLGPRELERLRALRELRILDTPPEDQFDAVCRSAQRFFGVPMALVSLVEEDRQWFKARCGLDVDGTSREVAFCTYAILSDEVLVVPDATKDERFRANPLVTGAPFIRFYAGAPLIVAPGVHVGTICIIDTVPRVFSAADCRALQDLATIVVAHLRLHKARVDSEDEAATRRANETLIAQQKAELAVQNRLLDVTLEHMDQGIVMVDESGIVQVCNQRALALLDLPATLIAAKRSLGTISQYQARTGALSETDLALRVEIPGEGPLAYRCAERERPDGTVLEIRTVPLEGGGAVCTYTDITLRKEAERRLEHQARHDALTGLPNRRHFQEQLQQRSAEVSRHSGTFALLLLDFDRFKQVNDTLGHPAGDALLKAVAQRLTPLIRVEDTFARLGGDEFAILQVGGVQPESAASLAQRLIDVVGEPFTIDEHSISIGLSVGIAVATGDGPVPNQLLKKADLALYRAKEAGRNTFRM